MSECHRIESMLSDYLDRDLPADACLKIDEHLKSCRACAEAAQALRSTVQLCREYRATSRPGPLPAEKHQEMKAVLQDVLGKIRSRES
jgi:anti-sigma factor RsiW